MNVFGGAGLPCPIFGLPISLRHLPPKLAREKEIENGAPTVEKPQSYWGLPTCV